MRTRIVKIGNSQGVRIPRLFLQQVKMTDEVELEVRDGQIVITPVPQARSNWEQAFREMAQRNDDALIDRHASGQTTWDDEEWVWE